MRCYCTYLIVSTKWPLFQRRDYDGVVKYCFSHFPSFFSLNVDNYGNVSQFHAGKHFYYTISMFQLIRVFMCRDSATSCDFYRRRQVDVFVLKTVEACAKFHEACQQTGMLFMGLYMTTSNHSTDPANGRVFC